MPSMLLKIQENAIALVELISKKLYICLKSMLHRAEIRCYDRDVAGNMFNEGILQNLTRQYVDYAMSVLYLSTTV